MDRSPWCNNGVDYTTRVALPLNIKNAEVQRLAAEVAGLTGESKTEAIRQALLARRAGLAHHDTRAPRARRLTLFLERRAWPLLTSKPRPVTKAEREKILGYGPDGV